MPEIQLGRLAALVAGRLDGDPRLVINDAETLEAVGPGQITFVLSDKDAERASASPAAAVVAPHEASLASKATIRAADPAAAFAEIVQQFRPLRAAASIPNSSQAWSSAAHPTAQIAPDAVIHPGACVGEDVRIGRRCTIHAGVVLGPGVTLGDDVVLHANVVVYGGCRLGDRTLVHAGAVLGAYGFGYQTVDGRHELGPQLGYVAIGADVEIGAGATIDRGSYGATRIGDGTKIDNLVMIAHNCQIGRGNIICSQVGVAGSTVTGDYVVMGGQCGVRDHVRIGHRVVLGAKSGVSSDVPDEAAMLGTPATALREQRAQMIAQTKLPEMRRQLRDLTKRLAELEGASTDRRSAA